MAFHRHTQRRISTEEMLLLSELILLKFLKIMFIFFSSGLIPSSAEERDETPEEKIKRLEKELKDACRHAVDSDRRCEELKKLQKSLDNEVQDLTETLFQVCF